MGPGAGEVLVPISLGRVWAWFWLGANVEPYDLETLHTSVKQLMELSQLKLPIYKTWSLSYALIGEFPYIMIKCPFPVKKFTYSLLKCFAHGSNARLVLWLQKLFSPPWLSHEVYKKRFTNEPDTGSL